MPGPTVVDPAQKWAREKAPKPHASRAQHALTIALVSLLTGVRHALTRTHRQPSRQRGEVGWRTKGGVRERERDGRHRGKRERERERIREIYVEIGN